MKKLFIFFFSALLFSCESQSQPSQAQTKSGTAQEVTINGKVKHPNTGYVVLTELKENGFQSVDSVKLKKDNTFTLKRKVNEPGFYMVNFFNQQKVLVILDKNNVDIAADGNNPAGDFTLKGSKDVEDLQKITKAQNELQGKVNSLGVKFQEANDKKDEKAREKIQAEYFTMQADFNNRIKELIREIGPNLASWYATNLLNPEEEYVFLDSLSKGFEKQMPNSKFVKEFKTKLAQYKNVVTVGQPAPEISLNNPEGNPISLSSLRGKYVLIDFWASWCGPCRQENPNVVRMYNKFKGKNFEIFGVSLDKSKEKWLEAIQKDQLSWVHVSDLKYWQSAGAEAYGVQSIPATFLVDPSGKVIAKNLRGKALEDKLTQILSKQ
ncbi:TlpA disulfide reductase family protein [Rhodocytophaga aerolata]|uniref:TlpA disulfide reductase family protein n=1 Tax=Rhodocytophaga aerolata TaxID=455078 RepID=A0ABT8R1M5_9BACT|nr:TlpA disulfide reductase family protein [Rhodocytophaga aerolata]MDO1445153.1 TlpA disulfide reductase family protein [Rhodocytophaga aerolata]